MALVRWAPARDPYPVQSEFTRLFTTLFDTATPVAATSRRFVPPIDVVETEQDFVLKADLPGLSEEEVKIEILEGVLTISGERRQESPESAAGYRRTERAYGNFSRSLTLPRGVDASAVSATFDRGVLEIHVPKPEESKPQAVQIAVGGGRADTLAA